MIEADEKRRLVYRRQYLISPRHIDCPFIHNKYELDGLGLLYTHIDLKVTEVRLNQKHLILLGDIFDYRDPGKDNTKILNELAKNELPNILSDCSYLCGRFVIIYLGPSTKAIFTDATASRKVYYFADRSAYWCASQPHLIARILGFERTKDPSRNKFYESEDFIRLCYSNIGNTTPYDAIRQLMPNHYIDIGLRKAVRFWPDKKIPLLPLEDVADQCSIFLKGIMAAIASRYQVMLPVTSGFDSRMLMAASEEYKDTVYYYINKEKRLTDRHNDLRIPAKIFKTLDVDFHILELNREIDKDFEEIYHFNNPYANREYLPHVYNYFINFSHKVNLPGNFAAATWGINRLKEEKISAENLAFLYELSSYTFAVEYYEEWLKGCRDLCSENRINPITLFYWEERIANWGTQIQIDKDIAQEDINPLNSRLMIENFLSVKRTYHNAPDHILHRKIIDMLWPALNSFPYNPGFQRTFLTIMKKIGMLNFVIKVRYKNMR